MLEKKLQKRTLSYIAIYQKVHLFAIRESNDIQWEGWIDTVLSPHRHRMCWAGGKSKGIRTVLLIM